MNITHYKRTKFYVIAACVMICAVIFAASYYTACNSNGRLSFSKADNDIYEVESVAIVNGVQSADNPEYLEMAFVVYFDSMNINYLEIEAKGITTEEVAFLGQNEAGEVMFTTDWYKMSDGSNYISLPSDDFTIARIYIKDGKRETIKRINFREKKKEPVNRTALIYAIMITAALITVLFIADRIRRKNSSKRNGLQVL